jgi:hypothetical protein
MGETSWNPFVQKMLEDCEGEKYQRWKVLRNFYDVKIRPCPLDQFGS